MSAQPCGRYEGAMQLATGRCKVVAKFKPEAGRMMTMCSTLTPATGYDDSACTYEFEPRARGECGRLSIAEGPPCMRDVKHLMRPPLVAWFDPAANTLQMDLPDGIKLRLAHAPRK